MFQFDKRSKLENDEPNIFHKLKFLSPVNFSTSSFIVIIFYLALILVFNEWSNDSPKIAIRILIKIEN